MKTSLPVNRTYRTKEFAQLAGVTIRALHHYDRLGLLEPQRTGAGYRAYSAHDLARLEQIIALKFIGIPLKKIGALTARTPEQLVNALRAQRQTLLEKQQRLAVAVAAIGEAENALRAGQDVDPSLYRRIIEVIEMQTNNNEWNTKYEGLLQAKLERLKSMSPEQLAALKIEWNALVDDVCRCSGEDPASPRAQALATRWLDLLGRFMGRPVDPAMVGDAAAHQGGRAISNAERQAWDYLSKVLSARKNGPA